LAGWCIPGVGVRRLDGSAVPSAPVFGPGPGSGAPAPADITALMRALSVVALGGAAFRDGLPGLSGEGVTEVMIALGQAATAIETMTAETTAEAMERDLPRSGEQALSPVEWVRSHHLALRGLGATAMVQAAHLITHDGLEEITEGLRSGAVPVATAVVAATETRAVLASLPAAMRTDDVVTTAVAQVLVTAAASGMPRLVRSAALELLTTYAGPDHLDRLAERAHPHRELTTPAHLGPGLYEYLFRTDTLGMATLEAALDPLAKPVPGPSGEPDTRSSRQRRADGLLTLIETAVAAPDGPATGTRGQLHVTIPLDALTPALRAATAAERREPTSDPRHPTVRESAPSYGRPLGQAGAASTAVLSPSQVRRLACGAGLIPLVLSTDGVIVDQGYPGRFFPPALVTKLWHRDQGCTFPGCTMPAKWTQAHHLRWHRHHGPTTLSNVALLCSYHHHTVHTRRLHGHIDPATGHITWNLTPGSYDHARGDP
jgi:hypothetical protein